MPRQPPDHHKRSTRLAGLSAQQDGVVSRAQLRELGFNRQAVAHQVASGRWQCIGLRVIVLHLGSLTLRQKHWVAVLHSGASSALSGVSAAHAEGLEGFEQRRVETVVPHDQYATDLDHPLVQVKVRRSQALARGEIHPVRQPARERLPSAVITAAANASSDDRARLWVIAAVQQRRVRCEELRAVLVLRTRIPRRRLITEAVADAEGGVHSLPERQWVALTRRYRLPTSTRQRPVRRASGTWYLDSDFDGYLVTVEINGMQHDEQLLAESDNARRNFLAIAGRLVLTFTSHEVRRRGDMCIAVTAAALLARGWEPGCDCLQQLEQAARRAHVDLYSGERRTA